MFNLVSCSQGLKQKQQNEVRTVIWIKHIAPLRFIYLFFAGLCFASRGQQARMHKVVRFLRPWLLLARGYIVGPNGKTVIASHFGAGIGGAKFPSARRNEAETGRDRGGPNSKIQAHPNLKDCVQVWNCFWKISILRKSKIQGEKAYNKYIYIYAKLNRKRVSPEPCQGP
jgi:hypothetical protein